MSAANAANSDGANASWPTPSVSTVLALSIGDGCLTSITADGLPTYGCLTYNGYLANGLTDELPTHGRLANGAANELPASLTATKGTTDELLADESKHRWSTRADDVHSSLMWTEPYQFY